MITLAPLGWGTTACRGFFSFQGVPPGDYTLRYSPQCTPLGCTHPIHLRIADRDRAASFYRNRICGGDCLEDGLTQIDEVIQCINEAVNGEPTCRACDINGDGTVAVDDLAQVVDSAMAGCEEYWRR